MERLKHCRSTFVPMSAKEPAVRIGCPALPGHKERPG